jgi:DNA-directed RNA polymerase subunit M/transcription elongation factor TFIIS
MAIEVTCPSGHVLKVKDKYAGKTGCCPHCNSRVYVPEPAKVSEDDILEFVGPAVPSESPADDDDESVYEHPEETSEASSSSSGMSLLGSATRHTKTCPNCNYKTPMWHATCPRCDFFFPDS